jgi:plastocyanin
MTIAALSRLGVFLVVILSLAACTPPTPAASTATPDSSTPGGYPPPVEVPTLSPSTEAYPAPGVPQPTQPPVAYPEAGTSPTPAEPAPVDTATPIPSPVPTDPAAPTATTGPVFITYRDFEIVPAQTTVKVGTTVVFLIQGSVHQPYNFTAPNTFEAPANLGNGTTYQYTFSTAATTTILCGYHPNMTATVVVAP